MIRGQVQLNYWPKIKYKEIQNIIEEKITKFNEKLSKIYVEPEKEINIENIKEVITSIKNNFIHLTNHERKMFFERFIKEIKIIKEDKTVIIKEVIF